MCQRKNDEKYLPHIESNIDTSIRRLKDNIQKRKEGLIIAASISNDNAMINRTTKTRKRKREKKNKQLHGYFKGRTEEISHEKA